jgi:hypothetical protein
VAQALLPAGSRLVSTLFFAGLHEKTPRRSFILWTLLPIVSVPLCAVEQPKDLFLAHRYDNSRVVIMVASLSNEDPSLKSGPLPPPAAGFLQNKEVFDIESARLPQLGLDRPIAVRVGGRYEVLPGTHAALKATVEKFAILNSCGFSVLAMLRLDQSDLTSFQRLRLEQYLARPLGKSAPPEVPVAPPRTLRLNPTERRRVETLLQKAMRDFLSKMDYRQAPQETARAWRSLAAGKSRASFSFDVQLVPLGPKYGARYYVRGMWKLPGAPEFVLGVWMRPGPSLAVDEIWPNGELVAFDNLEDARDLDSLPSIVNVFATADGVVQVLQLSSGHEIANLLLLEYVNGQFKDTGIVWGSAECG